MAGNSTRGIRKTTATMQLFDISDAGVPGDPIDLLGLSVSD